MVHKYSELDLMQARIKEVPKGWSFLPIAKAFKIRNDLRKPISDDIRSTQQGIYPYYGPTKIQDYIDTYEQDGSFALIGEDGDHFLKYKSQAMTQLVDGKCTVNNHAHIIEGTDLASREWFYYYFMHRDIYSYLSRQGAGRYKLNKASLEKIYVLIPPNEEQEKIAQILAIWDQAISATEKMLENSQQQKKALMQKLLTGKERLLDENGAKFSGEWSQKLVEECFDVGSSKRVLQVDWKSEGVPFYRTRELVSLSKRQAFRSEIFISDELFLELSQKYGIPTAGDFLVSGVGTLGISYQVKDGDKFYFKDGNVLWFKLKNHILSDYFKYCFQSDFVQEQIEAQASVTTVGTYTIQNAKKTKFWCPPSLQEQQKIAAVLTIADQEIGTLQKKLDCLNQEKKILMQQLLTGKKRVKVAA